jgi:hypothetical protein
MLDRFGLNVKFSYNACLLMHSEYQHRDSFMPRMMFCHIINYETDSSNCGFLNVAISNLVLVRKSCGCYLLEEEILGRAL